MPDKLWNNASAVQFHTTHWSVVLAAGAPSAHSETALETLCRTYWYPLYGFIRRRGYSPAEAQDLTQEFFALLLDRQSLETVHPEKGRFRSFLLAAMKNFLANEWRDSNRLKRGGLCEIFSWDEMDPEERYRLEPHTQHTPEELFDRQWAQTIVTNALDRVRAEMEDQGHANRFQVLKGCLQSENQSSSYSELAARTNLSEPALKSAIHRLRKRYADLVRQEIADTVDSPDEINPELRRLIRVLSA